MSMNTRPTTLTTSDIVTPISPFKPSTRLFSVGKNNNGLSTECLLFYCTVHAIIAITLIVLYIQALTQNAVYANLLCYYKNSLTSITIPCDLKDKELMTVYTLSIFDIISQLWSSKHYYISILLFSVSFIFPLLHIINNMRMAFHQNTSIQVTKNQSLCSSIVFECLNKLSMLYIFGCVLFINGLYQSTSTPIITSPFTTLYQMIVIEVDIAINVLIIANIISSVWTIAICYGLNNHHLFGHHRYIYYERNTAQFVSVALLIICGGIGVVVTYFMEINFIQFEYIDDWGLYNTIFDDMERKYGFISLINDVGNKNESNNNGLLVIFYWIYVVIVPIGCYLGYIVLCFALKYYQFEIKKVILMTLFYIFLCGNGLDMLLIASVITKYVLPILWESIMDSIYTDFCNEFVIIGNDKICDDLDLNVTLKYGIWIAFIFTVILLTVFCLINDFKCYNNVYSRFRKPTDSWNYKYSLRRSIRYRSSFRDSFKDTEPTESVDLSRAIMYYSSTSTTE